MASGPVIGENGCFRARGEVRERPGHCRKWQEDAMTDKPEYKWVKMWQTVADEQEMFISAVFYHLPASRDALLIAIEDVSDEQARSTAADAWAREHNLKAPWCGEVALRVAIASLDFAWSSPFHFERDIHLVVEYRAFDDRWESPEAYKTEARDAVIRAADEALASYTFRKPRVRKPRAFIWLVRYVVEEKSQQVIAGSEQLPYKQTGKERTMTAQNVGKSIRALAKRIELDLPKRRGGLHKANTT